MPQLTVDLTPFGFTPTESLVYGALLALGPSTGYALAARCRRARANTYAALEGLVQRGAALREAGRPLRYRPVGPDALIARLAAGQAAALDQLDALLRNAPTALHVTGDAVQGQRPVAAVVLRLVGRAQERVRAVLPAGLLTDTLPAWRRAAQSLDHEIRVVAAPDGWDPPITTQGVVDDAAWRADWTHAPTLIVADARHALAAVNSPNGPTGWWSSHPAFVAAVAGALRMLAGGGISSPA
jgi:transcriptional regulator TrmB